MKTKLRLFQARLFCAAALGIGSSFSLTAAAADSADPAPAKTSQAIPWSQLGAKGGADYQGDGLAVIPPSGTVNDRFRVVATSVGRQSSMAGDERLAPTSLRQSSVRSGR